MREIKFRVWDKERKEWVSQWCVIDSEGTLLSSSPLQPFHELSYEDFDVSFYTGLKDRNGVEICEGNIVKHKVNGQMVIDEIKWINGGFVTGEWIPGDICLTRLEDIAYLEIIGNIYENPELLESGK